MTFVVMLGVESIRTETYYKLLIIPAVHSKH